jgi:hypothetical protein
MCIQTEFELGGDFALATRQKTGTAQALSGSYSRRLVGGKCPVEHRCSVELQAGFPSLLCSVPGVPFTSSESILVCKRQVTIKLESLG